PGRSGAGARRHRGDRPLLAGRRRVGVGAGRWPVGVLRVARARERDPRGNVGDPPQHSRRARARLAQGLVEWKSALQAVAGLGPRRPRRAYRKGHAVMSDLLYEVKDKVATITLNRTDKLNAFTRDMIEARNRSLSAAQTAARRE